MIHDSDAELRQLSAFLKGYAKASGCVEISRASYWLERFVGHVCAQGYIGCWGGKECRSDHK